MGWWAPRTASKCCHDIIISGWDRGGCGAGVAVAGGAAGSIWQWHNSFFLSAFFYSFRISFSIFLAFFLKWRIQPDYFWCRLIAFYQRYSIKSHKKYNSHLKSLNIFNFNYIYLKMLLVILMLYN